MKNVKWLGIIPFVAILLSACTPIVPIGDITGQSAMTLIYDRSFQTVHGAWGAVAWIWGLTIAITIGVLAYKGLTNRYDMWRLAFPAFAGLVVLLIVGGGISWIGRGFAKNVATHAVQVGADRAKTRKANQYIEKLHLAVTKTVLDKRACQQRNNAGTGCAYEWTYDWNHHQVCTTRTRTDSNGNTETYQDCHEEWDTMHVPFFTEEWRTLAYFSMLDRFLKNKVGEDALTGLSKSELENMPYRVYSDWRAPENWDAYVFGADQRYGKTRPLPAFEYSIPEEWHAMDDALRHNRPYIVTTWHSYVNWVFVTADSNNLVTTSSNVEKYLAADVLPQINMLYSRFGTPGLTQDYDWVQFKGGLELPGANDAAGTASLWIGPQLQGSLVLWFVPAEAVDNPDAWITAAKAYLSDPKIWGFYMAPKNMVLIGCGVDRGSNLIKFCRMETGMPSGNVDLRYTVDHLTDIPFTNAGVFGTINASATPDANGFYDTDVSVGTDGIIGLLSNFKRVEMQTMDWLKTDIKLDKPDIEWAVTTETQSSRNWAFGFDVFGILVACIAAYALYRMDDLY